MRIFLDTSTLIKLYYEEAETAELDKLFSGYVTDLYISEIALIEFYSAIYKKIRIGVLTDVNAADILNAFNADHAKFSIVSVDNEMIINAQNLLIKYGLKGLRTLDALQFASVVKVKSEIDAALTSDILLKQFQVVEGIKTNI